MNFFSNLPKVSDGTEVTEIISETDDFIIERIVSSDSSSPSEGWYIQNHDEWVMLIQGNAEIQTENKSITLSAFDTFFIPAFLKHKVVFTSINPHCIWLAIHSKHNRNATQN